MKKIIPALALLLISAMVLASASYAWFSMNTKVTASNMQVKAVAEQGILINEVATYNSATWDNEATNTYATGLGPIKLHATSTANTATWYVAHSKVQDDAAAATSSGASANLTADGYKQVGTSVGSSGITATMATPTAVSAGNTAKQDVMYVDTNASGTYDNGEGYYAKFTYYLKSSAEEITTDTAASKKNLNIAVRVTDNDGNTENLDKALRVAVVIDGKAYFFAPLYTEDVTYYVNAATATTAYYDKQPTAALTIPDTNTDGIEVNVFVYFEGEDTNLKTSNIVAELDNLTIAVDFELVENAAVVTPHPVTVPTT